MTILTALAVFTIGLVLGLATGLKGSFYLLKKVCQSGTIQLLAFHKCPEGHLHAKIRSGNSGDYVLIMEDRSNMGTFQLEEDDHPT